MDQYEIYSLEQPKKVWEFGNDEVGCVSIFRGFVSTKEGFCVLGDTIEQGSVSIPQDLIPSFQIKEQEFVNPISFTLIWTNNICSIWRAVPPDNNYVSIGDIIQRGMEVPNRLNFLCIHKNFVTQAELTFESNRSCIWPNLLQDPLPEPKLSIWRIKPPEKPSENGEPYAFKNNYFIASASFERPKFPVYSLKNPSFIEKKKQEIQIPEELEFWEEKKPKNTENQIQISAFNMSILNDVDYIPVSISNEKAIELFSNWISSLWFAPVSLKNQVIHSNCLKIQYFPYFVFNVKSKTTYNINPIFKQNQQENEFKITEKSLLTDHCDLMFYAFNPKESEELISSINDWKLSEIQVSNIEKFQNDLNQIQLRKIEDISEFCIDYIKKNERNSIESENANLIHSTVSNIQTDIECIDFRLLFLPFYVANFNYENNSYSFFINAQNGTYNGSRPFNLFSGISKLWNSSEKPGLYSGFDLSKRDTKNQNLYHENLFYLIFNPSKRNLLGQSCCGWIKLHNSSSSPVKIRGIERSGKKRKGIIYPLLPGDSSCFPYKGNWFVYFFLFFYFLLIFEL